MGRSFELTLERLWMSALQRPGPSVLATRLDSGGRRPRLDSAMARTGNLRHPGCHRDPETSVDLDRKPETSVDLDNDWKPETAVNVDRKPETAVDLDLDLDRSRRLLSTSTSAGNPRPRLPRLWMVRSGLSVVRSTLDSGGRRPPLILFAVTG